MAVIGIDTAGRLGGVGVVSAGRLLGATVLGVEEGHSQNLLPALESLMERLDLTPAAVDGIAVAIGPGSFTGLRIGVAVAKALGYAWGVPVKGVSTLLATAWPLAGVPGVICASLDARKEHVFSATYAGERLGELAAGAVGGALEAGERHDSAVSPAGRGPEPGGAPAGGFASGGAAPLLPAEAVIDPEERRSIEEVAGALQRAAASGKKVYLVGDGAPLLYERLREAGAVTVPLQGEGLRAAHVAHIGEMELSRGAADDLFALSPNYLRRSEAERRWKQSR